MFSKITAVFNRSFIPICVVLSVIELTFGAFYLIASTSFNSNKTVNTVSTNQADRKMEVQPETKLETHTEIPIPPNTLNLRTLFFGDVFWGRYIHDWSQVSPLKTAYPFSGLSEFQKEKYDAWIADMECPVTNENIDSPTQEATLSFNCNSSYMSDAAKWFDIFTLANNHTDNMEKYNDKVFNGFAKTKQNMDLHNIQYFGHYDNAQKKDICEVVTITDKKQKIDVPIAMCGFHNVFKLPLDDEIAIISDYAKYLPTFVFPHQGAEYRTIADGLQRDFARQYIDAGADAVIGDHVHVVQDTDVYNGKLIVYSLGNFIFDQQSGATTRGIALDMSMEIKNDENMQRLSKIAKECRSFQDTCLQQIQSQKLKKPEFNVKYDIIPTDNTGKLAKKATPQVAEEIKRIATWTNTQNLLTK